MIIFLKADVIRTYTEVRIGDPLFALREVRIREYERFRPKECASHY